MKSTRANKFFRFTYNAWHLLHSNLHRFYFDHFRVNGTVHLRVDDLTFKMYSNNDDGIVDALYFSEKNYGEYEEVSVFKALAKHAHVIFDIGANTGLYSIISKLTNPETTVYAFEPYPTNIERLKKNLAINGLEGKINIIPEAVGNAETPLDFAVPENDQVCDVLSADIEFTEQFTDTYDGFKTVKVTQTTIDSFVEEKEILSVDLIKIDVENFELNVLKGSLKTLSKHQPVILAELFVDEERIRFFEKSLQPLGYHCYMVGKKGLFRTDALVNNPDCRNYLFSCEKSEQPYLSYSELGNLAKAVSQVND